MTQNRHASSTLRRMQTSAKDMVFAGLTVALIVSGANTAAAQDHDAVSPFEGFYFGVHGGLVWSDARFTSAAYIANLPNGNVPVSARNDIFDFDGGLFGIQGGLNIVRQGNILFGLEGDWSNLNSQDLVTGSQNGVLGSDPDFSFNFDYALAAELNWQATLRARLGYLVDDRTLIFGTIGVALLDIDWSGTATAVNINNNATYVQNLSGSDTLTGLALGGGIEFAVTEDVFLGADYLYENFGGYASVPFGNSTPPQMGMIGDLDVHKVRARLSFKLGGGE